MVAFISIFLPLFSAFMILVLLGKMGKSLVSLLKVEEEPKPLPPRPDIVFNFKIVELQPLIMPLKVGQQLTIWRDESRVTDGFQIWLKTLDGRRVGLVEPPYSLSFSVSFKRFKACEVVELGEKYIIAKAVFEGYAYITYNSDAEYWSEISL